jgi:hypothetical protein
MGGDRRIGAKSKKEEEKNDSSFSDLFYEG